METVLKTRTTDECEILIPRYIKAGYEFVSMLSSITHYFDDGYWDLKFKKC